MSLASMSAFTIVPASLRGSGDTDPSSNNINNDKVMHNPSLINFSGNNTTRGSMCKNSNTRHSDDGNGT